MDHGGYLRRQGHYRHLGEKTGGLHAYDPPLPQKEDRCRPHQVNTGDCLYYTRALKELGIAVIFEKENINSLEEDSELRITLSGAFAQSESESISANVTWGKRRAMESGKATIQYKYLYGFRRGADDKPEIIPLDLRAIPRRSQHTDAAGRAA